MYPNSRYGLEASAIPSVGLLHTILRGSALAKHRLHVDGQVAVWRARTTDLHVKNTIRSEWNVGP